MTDATWKLRWQCLLTAFRPRLTADHVPAPVRRKKDRRNHLLPADKAYGPALPSLPATTRARPGEVVVLCGPGPEVIIVQSKQQQRQPSSSSSSSSSSHPLWSPAIAEADRDDAGVVEAEVADVRAQPVEARLVVPEADLQMYAAIIGRIPVVDLTRPAPLPAPGESDSQPMQLALPSFVPIVAPHADRVLRNVLTNHQRVKLTSWLRQVSSDARRRIGQARTRLASRAA